MPFLTSLKLLEDDPIMKIPPEFAADPREKKANLGVGAYRSAEGLPWTLPSVAAAEKQILASGATKEYLPIAGSSVLCKAAMNHLFGAEHPLHLASIQTLGGSGALRLFADLARTQGKQKIYISNPSWPNHDNLFDAAGLQIDTYPYFDKKTGKYTHEELLAFLESAEEESIFLFQPSCHNPTGIDPTLAQFTELFELCKRKGHYPLFDLAYHGLGIGFDEDAAAVLKAAEILPQLAVCYSCSKNMGLYSERVGILALAFRTEEDAVCGLSHLKKCVRGNYSSPPKQGALIAETLLTDSALYAQWKQEVVSMRTRMQEMRAALSKQVPEAAGAETLARGKGMFALLNLTQEQVASIKKRFGVYMPDSGRINVAGLTETNLPLVAEAISHEVGK